MSALHDMSRRRRGRSEPFQPGDDGGGEKQIQELLAGGLTADKAAQIALLNNRKLQAALYAIGMARADVVQSGLLTNPTVGLSLGLLIAGGAPRYGADLAQNLAELWQIPVRRRAAERTLERTIFEIAYEASTTVADAKAAYYRAQHAERRRELATENVGVAQRVLDLALARQQAGAGSEVDVNLARAELQDVELGLRKAMLEAIEARIGLAQQLSLAEPPERLVLAEALDESAARSLSDTELLEIATRYRLDLKAARMAIVAAAARIREERLKVFPRLDAGVGFESTEAGTGEQVDTLVGPTLGLEIPIFNQNQGGIARAQYAFEQSRRQLEGLRRDALQQVRGAHARARTAWDTARYYREEVLPLRTTSLDLSGTAYQAGRTPLLNVLEAERALLTARSGYVDALRDSAEALVELEKVTGRPLRVLEAEQGTDRDQGKSERKDEAE